MYYVYALKSSANEQIYIGFTEDLKRRLAEHNIGKVWTTNRLLPVKLIFYEAFLNKEDAIRREKYLKSNKGKSTLKLMLRSFFDNGKIK